MKRLLTIMLITVILGFIAYGYVWVQNEKVGQDVGDFMPSRRYDSANKTTGMMMSGMHMSGDMMSGMMMSGMHMTGDMTNENMKMMATGMNHMSGAMK